MEHIIIEDGLGRRAHHQCCCCDKLPPPPPHGHTITADLQNNYKNAFIAPPPLPPAHVTTNNHHHHNHHSDAHYNHPKAMEAAGHHHHHWTSDSPADDLLLYKDSSRSSISAHRRSPHSPDEFDDFDDRSDTCGFWWCKPKWLRRFANKQAFLAVFCLTSVLQGMYSTYFVSVLTTIEKLYQIPSRTTGVIMSATEIGQIGGSLLLTYYGGQGHRPKWIACGMILFAFASMLCSLPHFIFIDDSLDMVSATRSSAGSNGTTFSAAHRILLCASGMSNSNSSLVGGVDICDSETALLTHSRVTNVVLMMLFASLLFIGIGATAVYTLGIPYIDDNVATRESPLYFGITIGVRIFGPVFGFLLGSVCTSVYVNFPFEESALSPGHPHWVGAWWLGVLVVGIALLITSFPMMAFPKNLPQSTQRQQSRRALMSSSSSQVVGCTTPSPLPPAPPAYPGSEPDNHAPLLPPSSPSPDSSNAGLRCNGRSSTPMSKLGVNRRPGRPSLRDFPAAVRRLLRNEILLYRTASSVLHILPIAGLYTFLPKYLESQFRLTETKASMITGIAGILVMGVGIFASGSFMRAYRPSGRFVARWIALCALIYSLGMVALMWVGCPLGNYVGLNVHNGELDYGHGAASCGGHLLFADDIDGASFAANFTPRAPPSFQDGGGCVCRSGQFSPVCSDGVTYLSPCLAGCKRAFGPEEQPVFSNCSCANAGDVQLSNGFCASECDALVWYIVLFSALVLVHSTSEVGSMLLTLRCVESGDKALALGLIQFAIGLFGNVPCPIIYGSVVDSACLFWEDNCGEKGACRVYDNDRFRRAFHGVTAAIMFLAFIVDAIVWYKADAIQIHDEGGGPANNGKITPRTVTPSAHPHLTPTPTLEEEDEDENNVVDDDDDDDDDDVIKAEVVSLRSDHAQQSQGVETSV